MTTSRIAPERTTRSSGRARAREDELDDSPITSTSTSGCAQATSVAGGAEPGIAEVSLCHPAPGDYADGRGQDRGIEQGHAVSVPLAGRSEERRSDRERETARQEDQVVHDAEVTDLGDGAEAADHVTHEKPAEGDAREQPGPALIGAGAAPADDRCPGRQGEDTGEQALLTGPGGRDLGVGHGRSQPEREERRAGPAERRNAFLGHPDYIGRTV